MTSLVDYQLADGIATLTLNDGKANVMSVAMLAAINSALDRADADQAVVLLTGRPGMFSGGFDLGVFKTGEPAAQFQMLEAGARLTERLLAFPQPVVVACSGHAIAMGVFILLSADVRVGLDAGARVQANEVQIGMTLPHFAIEVCRQRLQPAHLVAAAMTAKPYSPQQALEAGFFDALAPADALMATAQSHAQRLRDLHRPSFTATKLRLRQGLLQALHEAVQQDIAGWADRSTKT